MHNISPGRSPSPPLQVLEDFACRGRGRLPLAGVMAQAGVQTRVKGRGRDTLCFMLLHVQNVKHLSIQTSNKVAGTRPRMR